MKRTITALIVCSLILPLSAKPNFGGDGKRKDHKKDKAKRLAVREELRNDHTDTHTLAKLNQDPEAKDFRPADLGAYTKHSLRRIVRLNTMGALETEDANQLKEEHASIVKSANDAKADGDVSKEEREEYRASLDSLNDEINALFTAPEEGDERTPIVNRAQLRLESRIDAGERSGLISSGKASSLRRDLESLNRTEKRLKSGDLSTRDREKLMEEALEVRREITKALMD